MAAIDYYNNPDEHGNYQYVTLEQIINDFMMSRDVDDYTAMVPRYKVLFKAMQGFRQFYYDVVQEVRAIELELSPSLTVTLPPDYVNYVRISWVDENGLLRPMSIDRRMNIAQEYLQDESYNLLFDDEGCVLIGDGIDAGNGNTGITADSDVGYINQYRFADGNFAPNMDMSQQFNNGKYILDKENGLIKFGSEIEGRAVVVEYISDGLFTGCEGRPEPEIRIHKFAEDAISNYIYYELIKRRRNVPYNEKLRAKKEYWNTRRIAKMRMSTLRKEELLQLFRGQSKWIK